MGKKNRFENQPKQLQCEILLNAKDMHLFYTRPLKERDQILNRISAHNSKAEIQELT